MLAALRRPARIAVRVLLAVTLVIGLALGALAWWLPRGGDAWLEGKVRERLDEVVRKASVPGYRFTMDRVSTDLWSGDLRIDGLRLDFDSALADSLRHGAYKYLFAAEAANIQLSGLSYWRLMLFRELHAHKLELDGPDLRYAIGQERVRLNEPFQRLGGARGRPLDLLTIDSLVVRRAGTVVQDLRGRLPLIHVAGLRIDAAGVRIVHIPGNVHADLAVAGMDLAMDGLDAELADAYRLHIGAMHLSGHDRRATLNDLTLRHLPGDTLAAHPGTVMDIAIDRILLDGIDVGHLIADQALEMEKLTLVAPRFDGRLDKRIAGSPLVPTPLPPAALMAIRFPIRIDTVCFLDGSLYYAESNATTGEWGRLSFLGLQATITGIDNGPSQGRPRPGIVATIACTFLDSAELSAGYHTVPDVSDAFTFEATLMGLPFASLNPVTEPLLRLRVNAGQLQRLHVVMNGDDDKAKNTMELTYRDLHARVAPGVPAAQRHSMFGDLLDHVLTADNGGGLSDARKRSYIVEREKDRSFFTYIWQVTRTGLTRDLVPGVRERLTTLLKKEREQRRAQRIRRRAQD